MVKDAYTEIEQRIRAADVKTPNPLRGALTDLFVNHPAVRPHDLCDPAKAKMIRYRLANGRSLGHQIETSPQHLWFASDDRLDLPAMARAYPVTEGGKGRHSNVNQMPDLRDQAVTRVTVQTVEEAEVLLNALLA